MKKVTIIPYEPVLIHTPEEYTEAIKELDYLMDLSPPLGSPQARRLELVSFLIEHYEKDAFHIDLPDAIFAIKYRMEEQGLKQKDLIPFIGSKSMVSGVLSRKRPLTLSMIRKLHVGLGIPLEVLVHTVFSNVRDAYAAIIREGRK